MIIKSLWENVICYEQTHEKVSWSLEANLNDQLERRFHSSVYVELRDVKNEPTFANLSRGVHLCLGHFTPGRCIIHSTKVTLRSDANRENGLDILWSLWWALV